MTHPRKPSETTCRALCEATLEAELHPTPESYRARAYALSAYRAESTPLRTRAEVDAEIAKCVRDHQRADGTMIFDAMLRGELERLCSEPTAPEPAPEGEAKRQAALDALDRVNTMGKRIITDHDAAAREADSERLLSIRGLRELWRRGAISADAAIDGIGRFLP